MKEAPIQIMQIQKIYISILHNSHTPASPLGFHKNHQIAYTPSVEGLKIISIKHKCARLIQFSLNIADAGFRYATLV